MRSKPSKADLARTAGFHASRTLGLSVSVETKLSRCVILHLGGRLGPTDHALIQKQFRSAPRTCRSLSDRLKVRETDRGGKAGHEAARVHRSAGRCWAVGWPRAARGQQGERVRRIGALIPRAVNDPESVARIVAFAQALQQLGWTEGRNLRIDTVWAGGSVEEIRKH